MLHAEETRAFIKHHYRHFNAAALIDAARGLRRRSSTTAARCSSRMAGAMSTAELGLSLAEMIRQDKVHAICCTGANLEEDLYNLVAHDHYVRVPNYRELTPARRAGAARAAPQPRDRHLHPRGGGDPASSRTPSSTSGRAPSERASACFPHEFLYRILRSGRLEDELPDRSRRTSWLVAAAERNLPIFVPGWEDSTCGNIFASHCISGRHRERAHRAHRASST